MPAREISYVQKLILLVKLNIDNTKQKVGHILFQYLLAIASKK